MRRKGGRKGRLEAKRLNFKICYFKLRRWLCVHECRLFGPSLSFKDRCFFFGFFGKHLSGITAGLRENASVFHASYTQWKDEV